MKNIAEVRIYCTPTVEVMAAVSDFLCQSKAECTNEDIVIVDEYVW